MDNDKLRLVLWRKVMQQIACHEAEVELCAMSKCAQPTASLICVTRDFGIELGIAYSRRLGGKTRHVKVQYLWIHDER